MYSLRTRLTALTPWQRLALAAWTVIAVLAVGRALLIAHPRHGGCYAIFADAGRHWLSGEDLYTPRSGLDVFRYSPLVASFLAPFGVLPDMLGSALLRLANLVVFCAGLAWWTRAGAPANLTPGQRAASWLLAIPLAAHSLVDVQTNGLAIGLLLLAVTAAARQRWHWSAALLLLACSIKVYPVSLAMLLVVIFPRRLALPVAVATFGVLALPFLLQRPGYVVQQYGDWVHWGLNDRHAEGTLHDFRDLRLLCRVWLAPLSDRAYLAVQLAAAAGIVFTCLIQRLRSSAPRRLLTTALGLSCCWMMVFGPATEHTTYIFLAPTLAWTVLDGWLTYRSLPYRLVALISFLLFTGTQVCLWFPGGSQLHRLAPHPLAGLLLMAALTATGLRRPEAEAIDTADASPSIARQAA